MEYLILDANIQNYSNIVPKYVKEGLKDKKVILFGGKNEETDELISIASFSRMPYSKNEVYLDYMNVAKDFRKKGYGTELLNYCSEKLKEYGIRTINVKLSNEKPYVRKFFMKQKFIPISFNGHLIEYDMADMLDNEKLIKLVENIPPNCTFVESYDDYRLRKFFNEADIKGHYMGRRDFDMDYSCFYEEKEEIKACILFERINDKALFLSNACRFSTCKQKAAFAYMLAAFIERIKQKEEEDLNIKMQIFESQEYNFLNKLGIKKQMDCKLQEMVKVL